MVSLADSIEEKYGEEEEDNSLDYGFIVFVSSSPEMKKGMLPPILTLNDYNIEHLGDAYNFCSRCSHIAELDLTDNLLSDWAEIANILSHFPALTFLNLSNNLLNEPLDNENIVKCKLDNRELKMNKLVLNGNNVSWQTVVALVDRMPKLEELHLSTNNLDDPHNHQIKHSGLRQLYLSCNPISDFSTVATNLLNQCNSLELISLAECPVKNLPDPGVVNIPTGLNSLNLSITALSNWSEVDKLRKFPGLSELRIHTCPFLDELSAHERRMLLIARLPNIKILNGGDKISSNEREDAERAFIRFYLEKPEDQQPDRFRELIEVHGRLDPLVNIDLTPEVNIKVKIYHQDECREENISVRQTVKHFKTMLQNWFHIAPANMRLYYYDQEMSKVAGPEEMKWGQKGLYTYNVREGDYFVVDEKAPIKGLRTSRSLSVGSSSPKGYTSLGARTNSANFNFGGHSPTSPVSPKSSSQRRWSRTSPGRTSPGRISPSPGRPTSTNSSPKSSVSRNLFNSGSGSRNQHYGEFHHSKVFRDPT